MPMITDSRAIPHILQVFSISSSSEHYIGLRSINQNKHKNHVWPCDSGSPLRPSRAAAEPGGYDSVTAFRQYALQESVGLWRARGLQKLARHSHQPPPLPLRLFPQKVPGHPHAGNVLELDGHQHPEGPNKTYLCRHDQTQARVAVGSERRQDAQPGTRGDGFLLRQHTGAAYADGAGTGNFVEEQQILAEHQVIHITDKAVLFQIAATADRTMLLQVVLASVQAQYIVGELGDDERSPLGALQGDDDICLMARQAYRPGQRQQVQMQMRVTMAELTQLPGHQHGAIALGNADTHLPGQAVTRAG